MSRRNKKNAKLSLSRATLKNLSVKSGVQTGTICNGPPDRLRDDPQRIAQ